MRSVVLVVPGPARHPNRRLRIRSAHRRGRCANDGWWVDVRELERQFPSPTAPIASRPHECWPTSHGSVVVVDGLALGALPGEIERAASRLRIVALVHHPLALETGLPEALRRDLEESERRALAFVRRVVVTSHATAATLADYAVTPPIASTWSSPEPIPRRRQKVQPVRTGAAALCGDIDCPQRPRTLFQALAAVPERNWRLRCVGSERDSGVGRRLRELVRQLDLHGPSDLRRRGRQRDDRAPVRRGRRVRAGDVVRRLRYGGRGSARARAADRQHQTGAIPEIVPAHAGLLVLPGDVPALTARSRRS